MWEISKKIFVVRSSSPPIESSSPGKCSLGRDPIYLLAQFTNGFGGQPHVGFVVSKLFTSSANALL